MGKEDTIILRFRDLTTLPGNTIREHREIIGEVGYTWWGWWRKAYEVVPDRLFWELKRLAPLDIFLFHSDGLGGGFHLYRASLQDISVSPTGTDIPSPNVTATPLYYNSMSYRAWFKLTNIDSAPTTSVRSILLTGLPTWPESSNSDPDPRLLIGKEIRTQEALQDFNVTLWLVKIIEG